MCNFREPSSFKSACILYRTLHLTDAALGLVPGTAVSTGSRTHLSTSGGVGFEADWVAKSGLPGLVSVSSSMFVRDEGWVVDVDEFGRRAVKQDALQQHETFYYAVQVG